MPASKNDIDVRRHLTGLLCHDETLDEFIDWFHPANWLVERLGSDEDYDIASRIELVLAELSGGWIDDDGVFEALRETADEFEVQWRPATAVASPSRLAS